VPDHPGRGPDVKHCWEHLRGRGRTQFRLTICRGSEHFQLARICRSEHVLGFGGAACNPRGPSAIATSAAKPWNIFD